MRTYAKKKEHTNAPIGPFATFSHCACGYNICNELISAAKNTEHQYQYDELTLCPFFEGEIKAFIDVSK